jgi:hypothetical protein
MSNPRVFLLSLLSFAALSAAPTIARAQLSEAASASPAKPMVPRPASDFPFYVGVSGGVGYATLTHPAVGTDFTTKATVSFVTPALNLHAGYTVGEHVSLGLEFSAAETTVGRDSAGEFFKLGYRPAAECTNCHGFAQGSDVLFSQVVFGTAAARVEYAPFSRDGLFVGGSAGVAYIVGIGDDVGFGFSGRVGYRLRPTNILTASLEAGVQGQVYGDASLYMPYGALVLRPYF